MNAKVEKAGPPNGKVPKQNLKKRGGQIFTSLRTAAKRLDRSGQNVAYFLWI